MRFKHFLDFNLKVTVLTSALIVTTSSMLLVGCSNTSQPTDSTVVNEATSDDSNLNTNDTLLVYGEAKIDQVEELQLDFPARITSVNTKEGDVVNKGDILIDLNFDDYKLQISTLEKELEGYELELKGLKNNTNAQSANLDAISKELALKKGYATSGQDPDILPLKNNLNTLNADLAEAQKLYDSNLALFESGAISQDELTQSKIACEKINQQIQNVNTSIQKAEDARQLEITALQSKLNATTLEVSNIDTSKASQINQLQVKIESAHLTLQNMKAKLTTAYLSDSQVISPKDNLIIYDIITNPGASVSGLGQTLLKFMDLSTLYVVVDIPEESLSQVAVNAPVTIKLADKTIDAPITGVISRISNYAQEKEDDTVVEAYVQITSGNEYLKPGLSVDAYIQSIS